MQTTLNIFALTRSEKTSKDVSAFLDGVDGLVTKVSLQPDGVTLPDESALPDVLLYEVTDPTQAELTLLESFIAAHRASTTVLAIGTTSDTELLRRLMRAGVRDVVPSPLVRQEIVTICTNLLSDKRAREAEQSGAIHAVCAFMDAKGGSGATTIAVNVAAMLAQVIDTLEAAGDWLLASARQNAQLPAAAASALLELFGICLGGWAMADAALAAAARQARGDAGTLPGRQMRLAAFYRTQVFPQAQALRVMATEGAETVLALTPEDLGAVA